MADISFDQFDAVDLRIGTVVKVEPFPKARKPAYKIWVDFGPSYGVKQTSAQVTVHYTLEALVGKQVIGCLNLGTKNIGGFTSEFLCTGFPDANGDVVLAQPEQPVPNGAKLF